MHIKSIKKVPAPTHARVTVSASEHDGERRTVVHIAAIDAYGVSSIVAVLTMTPEEARDLALRIDGTWRA